MEAGVGYLTQEMKEGVGRWNGQGGLREWGSNEKEMEERKALEPTHLNNLKYQTNDAITLTSKTFLRPKDG